MLLLLVLLIVGMFSFFFDYLLVAPFVIFFLVCLTFVGGVGFSGVLFFDSFSYILVFLTVIVFILCYFSSLVDYWASNYFGSFGLMLGLMWVLLLLSFSCFSAFLFYLSFEFLFFLMFIYLLSWGYSPERLQASFYMLFYTLTVSFPFLVCLVLSGPSFVFGTFLELGSFWWVFFVLVFLVKLPSYGVHLWLPKAHVEAPVSGSMLLAGILLKLGAYGLVRFSGGVLLGLFHFKGYLISLGLLGGLLSCLVCLRQSDLKAFVAYSSVCHMGFALAGLFSMKSLGYLGALMMLVAHGYCSSCLFYILYVFYERFYSRSLMVVKGLDFPILMGVWFIFSVLNMGVPPSFSFFSEVMLLSSVSGISWATFILSGLMLFLAGLYCVYLYVICFHGKGIEWGNTVSARELLNFYLHGFYLLLACFFFCFFF